MIEVIKAWSAWGYYLGNRISEEWAKFKIKLGFKPLFKLTKETLDSVMIYGGIDWSVQNEALRSDLESIPFEAAREQHYKDVMSMREWIETERNREHLSYFLPLMTPEKIKELETRISKGERLEYKNIGTFDDIREPEQPYELPY